MIDEKVLIEKLEENKNFMYLQAFEGGCEIKDAEAFGRYSELDTVIRIVKLLASEHNNGWIPCSERLPEEKGDYLVTCNDGKVRVWWFVVEGDFKRWLIGVNNLKPIAWQPLPPAYKKGE